MPTVEVWEVGSGGDYSTPQLAEDDLPDLVATDKQIDLALFNQEWTAAGAVLTLAGVTVDATRFVRVIWFDPPDRTELPVRYNTSAGPCLRCTAGYATAVYCNLDYTKFVGIQIKAPGDSSGVDIGASYVELHECLIEAFWRNVNANGTRNGLKATNTVFVKPFNGGNYAWLQDFGSATIDNCTIVRPTNYSTANTAFYNNYFSLTVRNTVVIGFTNFSDTTPASASNNAGSMASVPGSGSLNSLTPADLFEEPSNASSALDLRLKAGSDLIDAGADLSASGVTTDYAGTARSDPYDIGAWEVAASGVDVSITGAAMTAAAGTLAAALSVAVAGAAGTSAAGTLTSAIASAVSGAAATVAAGTATAVIGMALTGAGLTMSAGLLAYTIGFTLTGAASTAAGGALATSGGDTAAERSLTGISMTALPGNVRVTGGTRWRPQAAQAVVPPSMAGNTLPPPPRLVGSPQVDNRAIQQWLQTLYDRLVKEGNILGRVPDHERRLAALEQDNDPST
jgi:hypothetical protein